MRILRVRAVRLALFVAAAILFSNAGAQGVPEARSIRAEAKAALERNPNLRYSSTSLIVKFRREATDGQRSNARAQVAATRIAATKKDRGIEILGTRMGVERAVQRLRTLPWVEYADLDYVVHANVIPNDASFGVLWGLHNTGQSGGTVDADIDAPEAWDVFTGSANTVVAVIDTGVERTHPDLAASTWVNPGEIAGNSIDDDGNGYVDDVYGWDFYNGDNNPTDDHGHGTHVAGTIGATGNNATGVTGVNWQVKIAALKFLNSAGSGFTSDAILAIDYCLGKNIGISNNSWGGDGYEQAMYDTLDAARTAGHIFVAAAGNSNSNNDLVPHYPSSYNLANVIAVAAIARNDARSSFSSYGATSVDLGAPGSEIRSTYIGGLYATMSGTSMATPHVTGAVALLAGFRPDYSWPQIVDVIFATVRPTAAMSGTTVTGGVLNLNAMLIAATPAINTSPTVVISSPAEDGSSTTGESVTFTGSAEDGQDGFISAGLSWNSNRDGAIGSGATFSTSSLSVGAHTITASVTDSGGMQGSATIIFTVNAAAPPNTPPTVTINSPANGASVAQGTTVTFSGTATDAPDGGISANLSWRSSIDGAIGSGASFSKSNLSVGTHTITASVTDSGGLDGSASISVTITAALPNAPSNLSVSRASSGVARLAWADNSGNETGFTIERQKKARNGWGSTVTFNVAPNTVTRNDSAGSGQFRYRIRAYNGAGNSAWTAYVSVKL